MEKQEFVAIDRFTGGGAPQLKFNATSRYQPILKGQLSIDLARLAYADAGGWAIALLVLVLRDLVEGDIRLGFGSAKGFGALHAELQDISIPAWKDIPDNFNSDLIEKNEERAQYTYPNHIFGSLVVLIELWFEELIELCKKYSDKELTVNE